MPSFKRISTTWHFEIGGVKVFLFFARRWKLVSNFIFYASCLMSVQTVGNCFRRPSLYLTSLLPDPLTPECEPGPYVPQSPQHKPSNTWLPSSPPLSSYWFQSRRSWQPVNGRLGLAAGVMLAVFSLFQLIAFSLMAEVIKECGSRCLQQFPFTRVLELLPVHFRVGSFVFL